MKNDFQNLPLTEFVSSSWDDMKHTEREMDDLNDDQRLLLVHVLGISWNEANLKFNA